jgi:hypothetical protein
MKRSLLALAIGIFAVSLLSGCEQQTAEEREARKPRDTSDIEPRRPPGPSGAGPVTEPTDEPADE